jgi:hypothetical protein
VDYSPLHSDVDGVDVGEVGEVSGGDFGIVPPPIFAETAFVLVFRVSPLPPLGSAEGVFI